jgi:SM-20-related protein
MTLQLNPKLDLPALARELQEKQRLRIPNILTTESAEKILECLKTSTAWHLVHSSDGNAPTTYSPEKLATMSETELADTYQQVQSRAASSYQFLYKFFPIIDAIQANRLPPTSVLFEIATFLNGTEFLRFARDLTNNHSLVKVDPQASLYEAGHFLNIHDDTDDKRSAGDGSIRRYAMVLGFTKNWSAEWGGQTLFFDRPNAEVAESWNPAFNSLTIFKVPVLHCVNFVTPFAPKGRYSVTGWLREHPGKIRPDLGDQ